MSSTAGAWTLVTIAGRRDRITIPVWLYALTATAISTVYSFKHLYPSVADRLDLARGVQDNATLLALVGRLYAPGSVGGLVAWRLVGLGSALVAVMSVLLVVRHTRADEEQQRLELVRSAVVGRQAPLAAALVIAALANVAIAVAAIVGLVAFGLPLAGSIGFGLAWWSVGISFAAIAAVSAQLAETSRTANGIALTTVAVAFLLRGIGDATSSTGPRWLSWLSPIGWAQQTKPFAGERWVVFVLPAALTAAAITIAVAINARRDLGAGAIEPRPGPASAGRELTGCFGLAWRIHRAALLGWSTGLVLLGLFVGSAASSVGDLVGGSGQTSKIIKELGGGGSSINDSYLVAMIDVVGLLAAAYAIRVVLQLRDEESAGRAELLLAGPVSKLRWTASHVTMALGGSAVLLAVAGLGFGVGYGVSTHDLSGQVLRLLGATLAQLPAVWVLAALTLVIHASLPRATNAAWGLLGACLLIGEFGPTLQLSRWVLDLSPFTHLPALPGGTVAPGGLVAVSVVALGLLAVGAIGAQQRDLQ